MKQEFNEWSIMELVKAIYKQQGLNRFLNTLNILLIILNIACLVQIHFLTK